MKELSIEGKAKRYDESLERAKEQLDKAKVFDYKEEQIAHDIRTTTYAIFPELKEESEDERMRNTAINACKYMVDNFENSTKQYEDAIAWLEKQKDMEAKLIISDEGYNKAFQDGIEEVLTNPHKYGLEKQGEQKPVDKIKAKFKVGDKIKLAREPKYPAREIIAIQDDAYYFDEVVYLPFSRQDEWELVEQKPADKVEPKFHESDWVVSPNGVYWHIDKISNNRYEVTSNTGESSDWNLDTNIYHKFTIQDAKDGDVLYSLDSNKPFIYKERKLNEQATAYCGLDIYGKFFVWGTKDCVITLSNYVPATKEQRDLLFKAMHEAGYEWDAAKLELRKIEQMPAEDRYMEGYLNGINDMSKKLKPAVWSEEDERHLNNIIKRTVAYGDSSIYGLIKDDIAWLKSLKERVQPKQEWSEEDERIRQSLITDLSNASTKDEEVKNEINKDIVWLKSLRPQNTWKPSDEQIEMLENVRKILHTNKGIYSKANNLMYNFEELIRTLKKLKE